MLALSIFTCSHPHTIVDELELNFCVRDGNRWTLKPINTNYFIFALFRFGTFIIIARFSKKSSSFFIFPNFFTRFKAQKKRDFSVVVQYNIREQIYFLSTWRSRQ